MERIQLRKRDLVRAFIALLLHKDGREVLTTDSWPDNNIPFGSVVRYCGGDWRFVIGDFAVFRKDEPS